MADFSHSTYRLGNGRVYESTGQKSKYLLSPTEVELNRYQIARHSEIFLHDISLRQSFEDMINLVFKTSMSIQFGIFKTPAHINYISKKHFMPWLRDVNRMVLLYGICPYYFLRMKVTKRSWGIDLSAHSEKLNKTTSKNKNPLEKMLLEPEDEVRDIYDAMEQKYYYIPRVADFSQGFLTVDVDNHHQPVYNWYWNPQLASSVGANSNGGQIKHEDNMHFIVQHAPSLYTGNLTCPMVSYTTSYDRINSILSNDEQATMEASRPLYVIQHSVGSSSSVSSSYTESVAFGDVASGQRRAEDVASGNSLNSGSQSQVMRDMEIIANEKMSKKFERELHTRSLSEITAELRALPYADETRILPLPTNYTLVSPPTPHIRSDITEQLERLDQLAGDLVGFPVRLRRTSSKGGGGQSGSMEAMMTFTNEKLKTSVSMNVEWFTEAWMKAFAEMNERVVLRAKKNWAIVTGRTLQPQEEANFYKLVVPSVRANPVPLMTIETLEKLHSLSVIDDGLFKVLMAQLQGMDERLISDKPVIHPELVKAQAPATAGSAKKTPTASTAADKVAKKSKRKAMSGGADTEKAKKKTKQ